MPLLSDFFTRVHDPAQVLLALIALGVTAATTFYCVAHTIEQEPGARTNRLWHAGTVLCAGLGSWGALFTAVIGYRPELALHFLPGYVIASAVSLTCAMTVSLLLVLMLPPRWGTPLSGLVSATGIWAAHYLGFAGLSGWEAEFGWATSLTGYLSACLCCALSGHFARRGRAADLIRAGLCFWLGVMLLHFLSTSGIGLSFAGYGPGGYSRAEMARVQYFEALAFAVLICWLGVMQFRRMVRLRRLELAVRFAGDGVIMLDTQRRILWANAAVERLTGYDSAELQGKRPEHMFSGGRGAERRGAFSAASMRGEAVEEVFGLRRRDGSHLWCAVSSRPVFDAHGRIELLVETLRDVTAELEASRSLAQSRMIGRRLTRVAMHASDLVCMSRPGQGVFWANTAFLARVNRSMDEARGQEIDTLLDIPDAGEEARSARAATMIGERRVSYETEACSGTLWLSRTDMLHEDEDDGTCIVSISRDITREKMRERALREANRQMARQARHDLQSGLPNWRRVTEFISECADDGGGFTLILLGLDDFRQVVDTFGHVASHNVLRQAGERLAEEFGPLCLVGRSGGDELAIVLPEATSERELALAQGICAIEVVQRSIPTSAGACRLRASAGVRLVEDGRSAVPGALVKDAALALSEARRQREQAVVYCDELARRQASRTRVGAELVSAVERQAFEPFFQPQVTLEEGALVGFECLARWRVDEKTVRGPDSFLDFAERGGLMSEIERSILVKALDGLQDWRSAGFAVPRLSVNASVSHLRQPNFVNHLKWELDRRDLVPADLAVEVLETTLITEDDDPAARNIARLHEAGFIVELDDFGTGHAALANLSRLRIHSVKLDRSLVSPLAHDARMTAIVRAILALARELGITVIAEGAETPADLARLRELGCRVVQGYAIARPMPADAARAWLSERESALRRIG
ncbi:EAL domain-containing protein [Oceanicella sp. SM1341]|uniref:bifunctional diguanylate cyclase/phosphodiesterase n=1 Tax=Oceanicella sp. SM1341 TaxID=1548889 RepID=UPI000E4F1A7D|nr:EAL domain-containing protein [Oceanicella sp. SM1341]